MVFGQRSVSQLKVRIVDENFDPCLKQISKDLTEGIALSAAITSCDAFRSEARFCSSPPIQVGLSKTLLPMGRKVLAHKTVRFPICYC
jgi:hypothetical protein